MTYAAFAATVTTPDGPFTLLVRDGSVLASGWTTELDELVSLVHATLRPDADQIEITDANDPRVAFAAEAVASYYAGDATAPGRVPVAQSSGEFRQQAWEALRQIEPGEPVTYAQFAVRSSRPQAVRAAASACAMNAAALFVPCHRVLRSDGSLGGFRYGVELKQRLLDREARPAR